MGNLIKATCTDCDFEKDFNFGGNMIDFTVNNPVPSIHKKSGKFRNVNYFKAKDSNRYLFYSDKTLKGKNKSGNTIENFDLSLNEYNNYCPNCKKFSLDFVVTAFTD